MVERDGRTIVGSIVFIDIVRYSEAAVADQLVMKNLLNDVITRAVERFDVSERIVMDTGDGAAICFLGDPEDALFVAVTVNQRVREAGTPPAAPILRTGINLGPLKAVIDLNGQTNVIGDGINVAQRVMSFADEGEVLVSRSFYEVAARLTQGNERLFHYLGIKRDKHVREHQLYVVGANAGGEITCMPLKPSVPDAVVLHSAVRPGSVDAGAIESVPAEIVASEGHRLARKIGPLAKIIAGRAAENTTDLAVFNTTLAAAIPDEADRAAFLEGAPGTSRTAIDAAKAAVDDSAAAPSEADLVRARGLLATRIGPLADLLVTRAAAGSTTTQALSRKLAEHITNPADRESFLAEFDKEG